MGCLVVLFAFLKNTRKKENNVLIKLFAEVPFNGRIHTYVYIYVTLVEYKGS